ncbi:hypothetical protein B296_00023008 [Ensete ventricosum]|uniref:Uncharacterized protein n=1 Tax=Ensete ventricosum TaxID=4639 RepID=A0A426Z249_ENSVE|nr:hypothetical protein B296_00023008 [Ensete ventricosum]
MRLRSSKGNRSVRSENSRRERRIRTSDGVWVFSRTASAISGDSIARRRRRSAHNTRGARARERERERRDTSPTGLIGGLEKLLHDSSKLTKFDGLWWGPDHLLPPHTINQSNTRVRQRARDSRRAHPSCRDPHTSPAKSLRDGGPRRHHHLNWIRRR